MGRELAAMGVNVAYAPVCDLATSPANPQVGIRSFGDDPARVAAFAAAMVRGLRTGGVAAAAKHFPGLGATDVDSHHTLPVIDADRARLDARELVPFVAAIAAGAELVMSAHVGLPALTGDPSLPATLSRDVMHDLVRSDLGFTGLTITDALDMAALPQGTGQVVDAIAALRAGVDLLLCTPDPVQLARIEDAITHAAARRLFDPGRAAAPRPRAWRRSARDSQHSRGRTRRSSGPRPTSRSPGRSPTARITLVRDHDGRLPLRLDPGRASSRSCPRHAKLTPADTSASVPAGLADALRARWPDVDEVVTSHPPTESEIAAVAARARGAGRRSRRRGPANAGSNRRSGAARSRACGAARTRTSRPRSPDSRRSTRISRVTARDRLDFGAYVRSRCADSVSSCRRTTHIPATAATTARMNPITATGPRIRSTCSPKR